MGLNLSELPRHLQQQVKAQLPKQKRATKPKPPTEHAEQCAVIEWAEEHKAQYPVLRWLHAIPNGGKRHVAVALKLKAEGVKSGVADLFLPHAAQGYHGLYIEMKRKGGRQQESQIDFEVFCLKQGYSCETCEGADEAIKILKWYLGIGERA